MSAEVLREAAALMRERAEGAIASLSPNVPEWHSVDALMDQGKTRGDAEHIVGQTPAVALAVADWLASVAERQIDAHDTGAILGGTDWEHALAVARAYLGEVIRF
jgi:hypothetical protein